jgi:hypothetical protein
LFIPEIEQNRRICFRAKQKRLRIELPERGVSARIDFAHRHSKNRNLA